MIALGPESLDLATLRRLWQGEPCKLDIASLDRIRASAASVQRIVAGGETVYGINTGFGLLANTRIPPERLAELQRNLILSHSCGLGDMLPRHVVRLMIVLKLLGLGRGYSGVRPLVIDALQALLDKDAMPLIPAQGSVGASGGEISAWQMPGPAVITLSCPGRISCSEPRLSVCRPRPSNNQVTVCSPVCGCGGTHMPPFSEMSSGP